MSVLELALKERIRRDYSAEGMEELFLRLDLLHDYASVGRLAEVTPLSQAELRGWLEDLICTARETLREMGMERADEIFRPRIPHCFGTKSQLSVARCYQKPHTRHATIGTIPTLTVQSTLYQLRNAYGYCDCSLLHLQQEF